MYKRSNMVIGIVFVLLGVLFLLRNLNIFNVFDMFDFGNIIANMWPTLFLLIPSFIMHLSYFSGRNRDAGILVPGGILLGVGVTCQLSMFFDIWGVMWPGFIMAVAIGLFELYLFGTRDRGLLIPVTILGGLSIIFFTTISFRELFGFGINKLILPLVLILLGVAIMIKNDRKDKEF
ncbi:MAG: hypothetical protein N2484_07965 [Clostridia bacterium]|nr:hypothetical protein [Clostridia bacterium]